MELRNMSRWRLAGIFLVIFLVAAGARYYKYTFFSFGDEEAYAIKTGQKTQKAHFLVNHGERCSAGFNAGPGVPLLMGLITMVDDSIEGATAVITLFNLFAVIVAFYYFAVSMPPVYGILAAVLLAVNQISIHHGGSIWPSNLTLPFAALFQLALWRFLYYKQKRDFVFSVILAVLYIQVHPSGIILFPLLFIILAMEWKTIRLKGFAHAVFWSMLLVSPYLYYVISSSMIQSMLHYTGAVTHGALDLHRLGIMTLGMACNYSFALFMSPADYITALKEMVGPVFFPAFYYLDLFIGVCFFAGWISYIMAAIMKRAPLFYGEKDKGGYFPLSFQVAGLTLTTCNLFIMLMHVQVFPHYLLIMVPAYTVVAAWPMWVLWRYKTMRVIGIAGIASSAIVFVMVSHVIKVGGGHSAVFGPSYPTTFSQIKKAAWANVPGGFAPRIVQAKRFATDRTLEAVVSSGTSANKMSRSAVLLDAEWNRKEFKYEWSVRNIQENVEKHNAIVTQAISVIPKTATVTAHPFLYSALGGRGNTNAYGFSGFRFYPFTDKAPPFIKKEIDYIALDIADPRSQLWRDNNLRDLSSVLLNPLYGLVWEQSGAYVFKKGADKDKDYEVYRKFFTTFPAEQLPGKIGVVKPDISSATGYIRKAGYPSARKEFLVYGPYLTLPKGDYTAFFRLRVGEKTSEPIATLIVSGQSRSGGVRLIEKTVSGDDFPAKGEWTEFALPFHVDMDAMKGVEFTVWYLATTQVEIDYTRYDLSYDSFRAITAFEKQ